jgi:hypothetical protein
LSYTKITVKAINWLTGQSMKYRKVRQFFY